jgi:hypothetical protein
MISSAIRRRPPGRERHTDAAAGGARTLRRLLVAAATAAVAVTAVAVTSASASTSAPLAPAATASIPGCGAADLGVWVAADQMTGAAGTWYYPLEFTNLSRHTCSLHGFAGVSALDRSGHQLGAPAFWDHFGTPRTVTLAPGATAHSVLGYGNAVVHGNCPPASVRAASELRIYPPGEFTATHAMWDLDACAVNGKVFMFVRPIEPGVGTRGSN